MSDDVCERCRVWERRATNWRVRYQEMVKDGVATLARLHAYRRLVAHLRARLASASESGHAIKRAMWADELRHRREVVAVLDEAHREELARKAAEAAQDGFRNALAAQQRINLERAGQMDALRGRVAGLEAALEQAKDELMGMAAAHGLGADWIINSPTMREIRNALYRRTALSGTPTPDPRDAVAELNETAHRALDRVVELEDAIRGFLGGHPMDRHRLINALAGTPAPDPRDALRPTAEEVRKIVVEGEKRLSEELDRLAREQRMGMQGLRNIVAGQGQDSSGEGE